MTREAHISGRTKERNAERKLYKDRFHVVEEKKKKQKTRHPAYNAHGSVEVPHPFVGKERVK